VAFDLTVPDNSGYSTPLTPQEQQIEKMLQAVYYTARVMGTNPVLQTAINVSASVGSAPQKSSNAGGSINLPNITAIININSNAVPPSSVSTTPTNTPSTTP
jgi:hypothetical protein